MQPVDIFGIVCVCLLVVISCFLIGWGCGCYCCNSDDGFEDVRMTGRYMQNTPVEVVVRK